MGGVFDDETGLDDAPVGVEEGADEGSLLLGVEDAAGGGEEEDDVDVAEIEEARGRPRCARRSIRGRSRPVRRSGCRR
jgi:hypothetical protein